MSGGEAARLDVFADELNSGVERSAWSEDGGDAFGLEEGNVLLGDGATDDDKDVLSATFAEQLGNTWNDGVVGAGEDAQADAVNVFLNGCVDDHFRRLTEAGVDDLHAGVAQGAGDDFCASIMAVEAGFGNKDADWGRACSRRHRKQLRLTHRADGMIRGTAVLIARALTRPETVPEKVHGVAGCRLRERMGWLKACMAHYN